MPETLQILVQQLGRMFFAMLGAYNLSFGKTTGEYPTDYIQFKIKGCRTYDTIRIYYMAGSDTYKIEFYKSPTLKQLTSLDKKDIETCFEPLKVLQNIHCEDLHEVIENHTGLYVRMSTKQRFA
ncbi:MAG: hypothetical protein ABJH04_07970 [Cyclobacteriaceae bacterium]